MPQYVFAGIDNRIKVDALCRAHAWNWLVSFKDFRTNGGIKLLKYMLEMRHDAPGDSVFLLDSGAFSVWNTGISISLWEYIEFVLKWNDVFTACICLDVIDNPIVSEINHRVMQLAGCKDIMPVFHSGEPQKILEMFSGRNYGYVGLSPNNAWPTRDKIMWLDSIAYTVSKLNMRNHLLGCSSLPLISQFGNMIYTFDSTSWILVGALGNIIDPITCTSIWGISQQQNTPQNPKAFRYTTREVVNAVEQVCNTLTINIDDLCSSDRARYSYNASLLSSFVFTSYQERSRPLDLFSPDTDYGYIAPTSAQLFNDKYLDAEALRLFKTRAEIHIDTIGAGTGSSNIRGSI